MIKLREPISPPPCFYHAICNGIAVVDKGGKSLCRTCADKTKGQEFPLRSSWDRNRIDYPTDWVDLKHPV